MDSDNAPQAVAPLTPDMVNAIVRDMDDPRYPSRITVYCDECGLMHSAEYMVSAEQTSAERLEVARAHMRTQGWRCDESGDYCPKDTVEDAGQSTYVEPAERPAEWAHMAAELAATGHSREEIAAQLYVDIPTVERLLAEPT